MNHITTGLGVELDLGTDVGRRFQVGSILTLVAHIVITLRNGGLDIEVEINGRCFLLV